VSPGADPASIFGCLSICLQRIARLVGREMGIAVLKNVVFSLFMPPRPGRPFQAENIEKLTVKVN